MSRTGLAGMASPSPSSHPVITTTWNMLERMPGWPELTQGPGLGGTKQGWSLRLVSRGSVSPSDWSEGLGELTGGAAV